MLRLGLVGKLEDCDDDHPWSNFAVAGDVAADGMAAHGRGRTLAGFPPAGEFDLGGVRNDRARKVRRADHPALHQSPQSHMGAKQRCNWWVRWMGEKAHEAGLRR